MGLMQNSNASNTENLKSLVVFYNAPPTIKKKKRNTAACYQELAEQLSRGDERDTDPHAPPSALIYRTVGVYRRAAVKLEHFDIMFSEDFLTINAVS